MWGTLEDFNTITKKGFQVKPYETNNKGVAPISSLFQRQMHDSVTATTTMNYSTKSEKDLAGIVCYQSERFNYVFGVTKKDKDFYLVLQRTQKGQSKIIASTKINVKNPIQLQVRADGDDYKFNYSVEGSEFINLGGTVSGDILSTNVAGGFTGSLIGLYSTSMNDAQPE